MADYQIKCEVVKVNTENTKCQKMGDTFILGSRTPGGMCARAYNVIYSHALAMRFSEQMSWESPDGTLDIRCPDADVIYRLSRIPTEPKDCPEE
jgi:uncharacterized repeat protein (TIGR04076 family)